MSEHSDKLRKIRGLLAQAEDAAATPEEAAAFSAKAEQMMTKYAIERAMIDHEAGRTGAPVVRKFAKPGAYGRPKAGLLSAVATAYRCRAVLHDEGVVHVVGYASDLDAVEMLYTSLLVQGERALAEEFDTSRRFRQSWWIGFVNRVDTRLSERAAAERAEAGETSTALVLADRSAQVRSKFAQEYPNTRIVGTSGSSSAGSSAGSRAGSRASFGDRSVNGGRAALSA